MTANPEAPNSVRAIPYRHTGDGSRARGQLCLIIVSRLRLLREGLAAVLGREPDVESVVPIADTEEAIPPDRFPGTVVLVDRDLPDCSAAVRTLVRHGHKVVVLNVGQIDSEILACAEAGAVGYLDCEATIDDVLEVVGGALRGDVLCAPRLGAALLDRLLKARARPAVDEYALTEREREVARHLSTGSTNREIAAALGISLATVKNHVHHILEKLDVRRRGQAVAQLGRLRAERRA